MQNNELPGKRIVPVPLGGHKLPPLRYPYDALEPIIDKTTLTIHHNKHHQKYVDDLNKSEISAHSIRDSADYAAINLIEAQLAYNGSGHILHSIYWTIMTYPDKGGSPDRLTERMITLYFSSFEKFKAQFNAAAIGIFGSGWVILVYNPFFRHLEILTAERHENLTQWGSIPILVCDVWEHAYYLKYQNSRADYVNAWWRLINWGEVENRLMNAGQQTALII